MWEWARGKFAEHQDLLILHSVSLLHTFWTNRKSFVCHALPEFWWLSLLGCGFSLRSRMYITAVFPKGCVMDLWNFCKVWTLKSCPKALLLICFYWRKGKNGAHVCSASLTAVSSCVCRVQRCLGDMEITDPKSGYERSSGHRSSQVTRLWSCNMTKKYMFCYFQFSIKRVKKLKGKKSRSIHDFCLSVPHKGMGSSLCYLVLDNTMMLSKLECKASES